MREPKSGFTLQIVAWASLVGNRARLSRCFRLSHSYYFVTTDYTGIYTDFSFLSTDFLLFYNQCSINMIYGNPRFLLYPSFSRF